MDSVLATLAALVVIGLLFALAGPSPRVALGSWRRAAALSCAVAVAQVPAPARCVWILSHRLCLRGTLQGSRVPEQQPAATVRGCHRFSMTGRENWGWSNGEYWPGLLSYWLALWLSQWSNLHAVCAVGADGYGAADQKGTQVAWLEKVPCRNSPAPRDQPDSMLACRRAECGPAMAGRLGLGSAPARRPPFGVPTWTRLITALCTR